MVDLGEGEVSGVDSVKPEGGLMRLAGEASVMTMEVILMVEEVEEVQGGEDLGEGPGAEAGGLGDGKGSLGLPVKI